jgi:hypothetical protein
LYHHPLAFAAVIVATSVVIWVLLMPLVSTRRFDSPQANIVIPEIHY